VTVRQSVNRRAPSGFGRTPLEVIDGIPVFSPHDRYVENYTKIAADHVTSMEKSGQNPFIEETLWQKLEDSTRVLVEKYVHGNGRVLDAGVGLGRLLAPISRLQRYGIDISYEYLQKARQSGFEVAFARIEDMPYEDGFFDAVVACDVLEHVIDLHRCCEQLVRVLRPGGALIIRVPYLDDMEAYLDEKLPYEFIHVRSFDVASLRILFGKIFEMRYQEHSFVAPYLKDNMFKIRLLSESSPAVRVAREANDPDHPLWILRQATMVSREAFRKWIYDLRDQKPVLLRELLPELVEGLEVNIVFSKPPIA